MEREESKRLLSDSDNMKAQFKADMNGGGRRVRCAQPINKSGDEARAFLGFVCSFVSFALIMCFYFKLSVQQIPLPPPKGETAT